MYSEMLAKQENDYVKTTFSYLWANSRFYIFICTEKRLLSILPYLYIIHINTQHHTLFEPVYHVVSIMYFLNL